MRKGVARIVFKQLGALAKSDRFKLSKSYCLDCADCIKCCGMVTNTHHLDVVQRMFSVPVFPNLRKRGRETRKKEHTNFVERR